MNVKEFSFSCVSLFSYQGSCRSFLSATAFILYQSCFLFVKNFFNFFLKFFVIFELFISLLLLFWQLIYIIIFSVICQQLFLFTDNIVKVLYFLCHLSATTLILYHSCTPSVNIFFIFFTQKETLKNGNAFLRVSSIIIVY